MRVRREHEMFRIAAGTIRIAASAPEVRDQLQQRECRHQHEHRVGPVANHPQEHLLGFFLPVELVEVFESPFQVLRPRQVGILEVEIEIAIDMHREARNVEQVAAVLALVEFLHRLRRGLAIPGHVLGNFLGYVLGDVLGDVRGSRIRVRNDIVGHEDRRWQRSGSPQTAPARHQEQARRPDVPPAAQQVFPCEEAWPNSSAASVRHIRPSRKSSVRSPRA